MIRMAEVTNLERVLQIMANTITEVYSHYYAEGVVGFFLKHHSREHVLSDIEQGTVWVLVHDGSPIGTVTIRENVVYRLFVLQDHGDILVYDEMVKQVAGQRA